ncbi:MAG TPA: SusC/RagA family TonB-linked outer membrane protein, partial [Bacteroidales bacterium]|nr:SusC/RagA family TonB-linked outer membrane protein [Bacteroidales bacterium]
MKNFLMILLFLASTTVFAQRITVTGTVTDEGGSPLPGTTVLVKGTTVGVTTDANGKYSVDVSSRTVTLVFSFIGFVTQEVPVENRSVVDVILEAEITGLDEVIVVGYGTQKKSDITGTVASMPKERLEMAPNLSIAQAIQGAVPGVMIQSSNSGANPDQTILVRGRNSITANNDPLIIVDGIPYGGRISDVNPSDIQSIEVLKDASAAAIYGSRGSNGVILITTKEGIIGKVSFSAESKFTIMDVTKTSRPLTGSEFYDFKMTRYAPSMTASEKQIYLAGEGVDWVKLGLRTGQSQEHNLSVSGGFKDTKYYFGGGLLDIKSVAKGDNFRRFSSRINLESKIISWISLGTRTQLTFDDESGANANFENLIEKNPLTKAFDEDGKYTIYPWPENIIVGNPLEPLLYDDLDKSYQILTNNYAIIDFPFIKGLNYRLNTGIRMRYTDRAQYRARNTQSGLEGLGRASLSNSVTNSTIIENILSYTRVFGVHNV